MRENERVKERKKERKSYEKTETESRRKEEVEKASECGERQNNRK